MLAHDRPRLEPIHRRSGHQGPARREEAELAHPEVEERLLRARVIELHCLNSHLTATFPFRLSVHGPKTDCRQVHWLSPRQQMIAWLPLRDCLFASY
jgi:hypothetical protein